MRRKSNAHFQFVYPGNMDEGDPHFAIPNTGEWVALDGERYGGESSTAVFYNPQTLRELADIMNYVADLFEAARLNAKS